jgi:hypothetical protein
LPRPLHLAEFQQATARQKKYGPTFKQLEDEYYWKKGFHRKLNDTLSYRLDNNIPPAIGHLFAMNLTANHLEDYDMLEEWHKADKDRYDNDKAKRMHIVHYWGEPIKSIKRAWKAALINLISSCLSLYNWPPDTEEVVGSNPIVPTI